jgi:hypothetical protein
MDANLTNINEGKKDTTGFPVDAAGNYLTTLTYNETTRTVTVTPIAVSFDIFVGGVKYNFVGAQSIVHSDVGASRFVYFNELGVLVTGTSPWNLLNHAPVCFIFQDVTNGRRLPFEERHHSGRDLYWHRHQHNTEGTKTSGSGFAAAGYTLNSSGDANNTFSVSSGRIEDEDIRVDTEVLTDGGPYFAMQRSGASGDWLLDRTNTVPFYRSGTTIRYNQNTGSTWQLTSLANNQYVNYYMFGVTALPKASITPAPSVVQQYVMVPGQAVFATAALASAETVGSLSWGTAPFQEIVPLYKVTFLYQTGGGGTVQLASITRIIGTSASITSAAQTDHGALAGLTDLDHPASAIINTPAGNIVATDVQSALNELDLDKQSTIIAVPRVFNSGEAADSGAIVISAGGTAQRPTAAAEGHFRRNSELSQWEGFDGSTWGSLGGASGGGGNPIIYENDIIASADYTITAGKNGVTAGPITIEDGVTIGIPNGSTWSIVGGGGSITSSLGVPAQERYIATSGQTAVNIANLGFKPAEPLSVFVNGIMKDPVDGYTVVGNVITLASGLTAGDKIVLMFTQA